MQTGTYEALSSHGAGPGVFVRPAGPGRQYGPELRVEVPMWATRRVAYAEPHPDPAYALAVLAARLRNEGTTGEEAFEQALELLGDAADGPVMRAARQAVNGWAALAEDFDAIGRESPVPLTMAHVAAFDIAARRRRCGRRGRCCGCSTRRGWTRTRTARPPGCGPGWSGASTRVRGT